MESLYSVVAGTQTPPVSVMYICSLWDEMRWTVNTLHVWFAGICWNEAH